MITPEMLILALQAGAGEGAWLRTEPDNPSETCIDGWFDLAKMAEALNVELIRQAQAREPASMLDINVAALDGG
jgi:hypothetical protein